jgi:hypothetical protein
MVILADCQNDSFYSFSEGHTPPLSVINPNANFGRDGRIACLP